MPQTTPWTRPVRGTRDGVKDRHAKIKAPHRPGRVKPPRIRTSPGAGTTDGTSAGTVGGGILPLGAVSTDLCASASVRCDMSRLRLSELEKQRSNHGSPRTDGFLVHLRNSPPRKPSPRCTAPRSYLEFRRRQRWGLEARTR